MEKAAKTYYCINTSYSYVPKNKLRKALAKWFQEKDLTLWEDLDHLKSNIVKKMEILSKAHPRCKPVEVDFTSLDEKIIALYGLQSVHVVIQKCSTSCNHSCSPGDFHPEGKCGENGCC